MACHALFVDRGITSTLGTLLHSGLIIQDANSRDLHLVHIVKTSREVSDDVRKTDVDSDRTGDSLDGTIGERG